MQLHKKEAAIWMLLIDLCVYQELIEKGDRNSACFRFHGITHRGHQSLIRRSQEEPGRIRRSRDEPGGHRRTQEEPGPGGPRMSQGDLGILGGPRGTQEDPRGPMRTHEDLASLMPDLGHRSIPVGPTLRKSTDNKQFARAFLLYGCCNCGRRLLFLRGDDLPIDNFTRPVTGKELWEKHRICGSGSRRRRPSVLISFAHPSWFSSLFSSSSSSVLSSSPWLSYSSLPQSLSSSSSLSSP